jgi:hypothetical protein
VPRGGSFGGAVQRPEIRHAALSWDVHGFLVARLDGVARAIVVVLRGSPWARRHDLPDGTIEELLPWRPKSHR